MPFWTELLQTHPSRTEGIYYAHEAVAVRVCNLAFPVVTVANPGVSGMLPINPSFNVSGTTWVPDERAVGAALALTTPAVSSMRYRTVRSVIPFSAQVHLGFFDPIDNFSTGFDGGFRVGPQLDPYIQVGLAIDWWHRSDDKVLDLGKIEAPVGTANEELILSQSTANLVPILLFVQVSGDKRNPVIPYGGFGAGYEWLSLSANDYLTHESFDQTFGGFGWQLWVGAGVPLDWRLRMNAEAYFNSCEVSSEVDVFIQDYGPATVRDVIKTNGMGMRVGVSWGF